jgi:hypothetical protein
MKIIKECCEICNENKIATLHIHHIIEQHQINTSNRWDNLCCLCANCHNRVHHGQIKILGVLASTKLPNKRQIVYEENGIRNIDIDVPVRHCVRGRKWQ